MLRRRTHLVALLLAAMAGSTLAAVLGFKAAPAGIAAWDDAPPRVQAVMWPEPQPLADVSLQTQHGDRFGPESFEGQWSFMFFGYLDCPDVCPMGLHALREMREHLVRRYPGETQQYIFVSVDPENDDADEMAAYLARHGPNLIGLLGHADEIAKLTRSVAVKHEEVVGDAGRRSIDHTSSVMIIDPQGRMVGALPPPLRPERMAREFEGLRDYLALTGKTGFR